WGSAQESAEDRECAERRMERWSHCFLPSMRCCAALAPWHPSTGVLVFQHLIKSISGVSQVCRLVRRFGRAAPGAAILRRKWKPGSLPDERGSPSEDIPLGSLVRLANRLLVVEHSADAGSFRSGGRRMFQAGCFRLFAPEHGALGPCS